MRAGFPSQATNNIISLLQPISDGAKEVLSSAINFKGADATLYNKTYSLLIEIVNIVNEAPPLRRLDVSRVRDDHYQGDYEAPEVREDVRQVIGDEDSTIQDLRGIIPRLESTINEAQRQIDELQDDLDEDPDNDDIRDVIEELMQIKANAEKRLSEAQLSLGSTYTNKQYANDYEKIQQSLAEKEQMAEDLNISKYKLQQQRNDIESRTSGKRKQTLLQGIDKKMQRLDTQMLKLQKAYTRDIKVLKEFEDSRIIERDRDLEYSGDYNLALRPGVPNTDVASVPKIFPLIQEPTEFRRISPVYTPTADLRGKTGAEQPVQPSKPSKPARKGAVRPELSETERILAEVDAILRDADADADIDARMDRIDTMLRTEGFGKKKGRGKSGGAKAMTPDDIHRIVVENNKQFAVNNEATQLPRAPMTYLGLKADNSRGTLGAGKKDIVMKKKDFVKEHKNLVSLLGKTAKSLNAEASDQSTELGKIDPEAAKMLEKTMDNQKMKAGKKGKKKNNEKLLPTLLFDDKKNDWYL
jgi:hypothetical protein